MPKFFIYQDMIAFKADNWIIQSHLGLSLTKEDAVRGGYCVIYRVSDGKILEYVNGKWQSPNAGI